MKYRSLNQADREARTLYDVLLSPFGKDGSLYMPERLPRLPEAFFNNFGEMTFDEVAYVAANALFGDELGPDTVKRIVERSFNFPVPLRRLDEQTFVLELFHGPTLTFKDFGARFMAEMLRHAPKGKSRVTILTATTGNTGSAAANAFAGVDGVDVYILFPRQAAARQLESQFTTVGGNIHALEVQGTIDDCHALVAQAYADNELRTRCTLTSANSANIIRLLPQAFFYLFAVPHVRQMLYNPDQALRIGIPSGNLGNLSGALMARVMGLDSGHIIAAENANSALTSTLRTCIVPAHLRAVPTLAYAADKSLPTNLGRVVSLCGGRVETLSRYFDAVSVGDAEIISAVNDCYARHNYTIDPHTALAYAALSMPQPYPAPALIVSTAHPAMSLTAMSAITGRAMDLPLQLTRFMAKRDCRVSIPPVYRALRAELLRD